MSYQTSESDCYKEMPGKSTFTFLNHDKQNFLIDAYSAQGFRINQGDAFIVGEIGEKNVLCPLSGQIVNSEC